MNNVLEAARKSGARKAVRLDVSEPSHCPLLEPVAADTLTRSLQTVYLQDPKVIYIGNVTGRALRSEAISEDLASNIAHGVRWYDATMVLTELGCRLFLEVPPGHVLSQLGREAFLDVRTLAVGETSLKYALLMARRMSEL